MPDSPVQPEVHHTDTHGATLVLFGISYLLGIELQPWLARPATRQLFAASGRRGPEPIARLFTGDVDRSLIAEQWDRMLRSVVALTQRKALASVLVRRISGSRLGQAFVELGRLVRTEYLLRWLHDEPMRRAIRHTLNLMESRHKLSRDLFFGGHGRFSGHTLRALATRASSLALLSNCVVAWNAIQLHRAAQELRAADQPVPDDVLVGLSPLGSAHVQMRGIYRFNNVEVIA